LSNLPGLWEVKRYFLNASHCPVFTHPRPFPQDGRVTHRVCFLCLNSCAFLVFKVPPLRWLSRRELHQPNLSFRKLSEPTHHIVREAPHRLRSITSNINLRFIFVVYPNALKGAAKMDSGILISVD